MEELVKLLKVLKESRTLDTFLLSKKLNAPISTVEALLGLALNLGLVIRLVENSNLCSKCPLSKACVRKRAEVFVITEAGEKFIKKWAL